VVEKGTTSGRPRNKGGVQTPPVEDSIGDAVKNGERGTVSSATSETADSFRVKDTTPAVALDARLKIYEVLLALLILICTIFIGFNSSNILSRQNAIVARSGQQQYHAELLQGYISSIQRAGFDTEEHRRMLQISLDLYGMLSRDDPKFIMLATSMPSLTEEQLRQLIATRPPADGDAIRQLFSRRDQISRLSSGDAPYRIEADGPIHLVIGTFESPNGARTRLEAAVLLLSRSHFRPRMNIVRSRGLFLATLSGFETRQDAQNAIARESLETAFEGVYASTQNGWVPICSAQFQPCTPASAPPRRRPNVSARPVPSDSIPAPTAGEPALGALTNETK
jgi:hypothetical protein